MNDIPFEAEDDIPDWAWEIVERHQLEERTDCPRGAVTLLLTDAADMLMATRMIAFEEQAVTAETRRAISQCLTMVGDALKLSELCPTEPTAGTVTIGDDGTMTWTDDRRG